MLEDYYGGNHDIIYSGYSYEIFKCLNKRFPNFIVFISYILHINYIKLLFFLK